MLLVGFAEFSTVQTSPDGVDQFFLTHVRLTMYLRAFRHYEEEGGLTDGGERLFFFGGNLFA